MKEKLPNKQALVQLLQELGVIPTKKNPVGRPKKQVKRPVGRPKKDTSEKRPVGRPKKQTPEIKRPVGRPKKVDVRGLQTKNRRGRPRKYSIDLLNKPELDIVPVLIDILKKSSKPVHTDKLIRQINSILKSSYAEPTLRKVVNYIRAKSLTPIVSINGTGYEISFSKKKIKTQIDSLNKRASCIVSSAQGLKKFL